MGGSRESLARVERRLAPVSPLAAASDDKRCMWTVDSAQVSQLPLASCAQAPNTEFSSGPFVPASLADWRFVLHYSDWRVKTTRASKPTASMHLCSAPRAEQPRPVQPAAGWDAPHAPPPYFHPLCRVAHSASIPERGIATPTRCMCCPAQPRWQPHRTKLTCRPCIPRITANP